MMPMYELEILNEANYRAIIKAPYLEISVDCRPCIVVVTEDL